MENNLMTAENTAIEKIMSFEELNINEKIKEAIREMGFEEPSPIQAKAIPYMLEGVDIIAQAQTGTGKTAAFSVPILDNIDVNDRRLQAIIMCPTRELAIQVSKEIRRLAKFLHGIRTLPIYGGQPIERQIKALKGGVQIVIGTPGRVIDHINRRTLKLDNVKIVVLDEADEMLDMGFREDIESILDKTPEERQTALFSATMPEEIKSLAKKYQKDAKHIRVVKKTLTVSNIKQYFIETRAANKVEVLTRLIDVYDPKLSVVFTNTKKGADELVAELQARGYFADALHGDLKQVQRDIVMDKFRNNSIDVLVATDVAARGIDVDGVECVFNFDLPQDEEYYVHRIGRTGRAGREGMSFSFVFGREMRNLREIERFTKSKMERHKIPTVGDVEQSKADKLLTEAKSHIKETDTEKQDKWVEEFCEIQECEIIELAAALLKMAMGEEKEEIHEYVSPERDHRRDRRKFQHSRKDSDMVRLFINVGTNQRVQAKDIVGMIAGESNIPGRVIGAIDIYDKYTFADVPRKYYKKIIDSVKNKNLKGNKVNIERASRKRNK